MKATGIIRRVDDLGRIVIPKTVRGELGVTEGTPMELFIDGNSLILKKYLTEDNLFNMTKNLFEAVDDARAYIGPELTEKIQ